MYIASLVDNLVAGEGNLDVVGRAGRVLLAINVAVEFKVDAAIVVDRAAIVALVAV